MKKKELETELILAEDGVEAAKRAYALGQSSLQTARSEHAEALEELSCSKRSLAEAIALLADQEDSSRIDRSEQTSILEGRIPQLRVKLVTTQQRVTAEAGSYHPVDGAVLLERKTVQAKNVRTVL